MIPEEKLKYVVGAGATLKDALALIEANRHRSLIVVGEGDAVVGTLSDGDIRKALLKGRLLVTPVCDVMSTNFVSVGPAEMDRAAELFKKRRVFLIPVVDERARLIDILEAY